MGYLNSPIRTETYASPISELSMEIWMLVLAVLVLCAITAIPLLLKKRIMPPPLPPVKTVNIMGQARRREVVTMQHIANQLKNSFEPVAMEKGFEVEVELPHTHDVIGKQTAWLQAIISIRPAGRPHLVSEQFVVDILPGRPLKEPILVTSNGVEILSLPLTKEEIKMIIVAGIVYMGGDPLA